MVVVVSIVMVVVVDGIQPSSGDYQAVAPDATGLLEKVPIDATQKPRRDMLRSACLLLGTTQPALIDSKT